MTIRTRPWPEGVPCWVDLVTTDLAAAQRFYADVLGWSFAPPDHDYGDYVIADVRGHATAGVGPMPAGQQTPAWTLYLSSDDADRTASAVTDRGGTVLLPPGDVGPLGRMVIAADPAGGVFGVWQAGSHLGSALVNEPGGLIWEDLRSTEPDAALPFYQQVFGYELRELADAGPDYRTFHPVGDDAPLGGMGGMGGMFGAPDGTPSHWLVYFCVADVDAAVEAAGRNGGHVLAPAFDTEFGRMAGLVDPSGAAFWIMQDIPGQPGPDRQD